VVRRFDAANADCTVYTFREGLLAAVGHDLTLAVTSFTIELADDDAIHARFDAASLRVTGAVSDGDRRTIERHAADDVLAARRFPEIRFRSTRVVRQGERAQIEGELTLHGATRALRCEAHDDGARWTAEVTLDQRDYGIKPFTAMLGTLRVRADVRVRVSLPSR
jgi:polyisoprenoid-binding protein YceI